MSENKSVTVNFPIPFIGLLGLLFITLKLTGYIGWSWWLVLSPFWIPIAVSIVMFLAFICIALWVQRNK